MRMYIVFIMLILVANDCKLYAFDNKSTHIDITEQAAKKSNIDSAIIKDLGLKEGSNTILVFNKARNVLAWLNHGSDLEDIPTCRAANHFHNPIKTWDKSQSTDFWPQNEICQLNGWTPRYSNIFWATGLTSPTDTTEGNERCQSYTSDRNGTFVNCVALTPMCCPLEKDKRLQKLVTDLEKQVNLCNV